ncbi:uncharacterized protein LOC108032827 [Drosophila biarmipes]|uniref:uncharacterized protein LOC108032827 n=1 Tax=Drosophila biarmipes TaxID=125945 RepID=UPI0007E7027F|nr:uncharacterized protein LOC108032827 [Drosophila biarmipes]
MCARCDVNMAKLELKLLGIVLFLVAALEAQETPATESSPATQAAGGASAVTESSSAGETTKTGIEATGATTDSTDHTDNMESTTHHSSEHNETHTPENGGDPFVKPGKHRPGPRHVKAHDGFHNLRTEKNWAHWNDAFTTPRV